jgi:hypothetical protein
MTVVDGKTSSGRTNIWLSVAETGATWAACQKRVVYRKCVVVV